jgi:hypothetical protein
VPEVSDASSGGTVRAAARLGSGESVGDTGAESGMVGFKDGDVKYPRMFFCENDFVKVLILVIFGEN